MGGRSFNYSFSLIVTLSEICESWQKCVVDQFIFLHIFIVFFFLCFFHFLFLCLYVSQQTLIPFFFFCIIRILLFLVVSSPMKLFFSICLKHIGECCINFYSSTRLISANWEWISGKLMYLLENIVMTLIGRRSLSYCHTVCSLFPFKISFEF